VTGPVTTEVIGADELNRSLSAVADDLGNMGAAADKAGQMVRTRAQSLAPVNTGALARSITADAEGAVVTVGTDIPYGRFQEYGTIYTPASPYLRPALEASTNEIVTAYTGEVQDKLEHVKGA
jgi:HK97 gp10 family phage protein